MKLIISGGTSKTAVLINQDILPKVSFSINKKQFLILKKIRVLFKVRPPCKNLTVFQWKLPCHKDSIFYVDLKNRIYKENLYITLVTVRSLRPMVVVVEVSLTGLSRTELNLVPCSYSSTALSLHPCSPYSFQRIPSTF